MFTHQLSSKNLSVGEKLAMTEEFQEEVRLENEKKKLEGNSKGGKINEEVSLQLECDLKYVDLIISNIKTEYKNKLAFSCSRIGIATGCIFCTLKLGNILFFEEILIGFSLI